jgi:hypothetical protein
MEKVNVRTTTYAQLDCKYDALCLKDKIQCLEELLEYMQQYNGRTIKTCIFMAMGYEDCVGRIHKSNRPWVTYKNWKNSWLRQKLKKERKSFKP